MRVSEERLTTVLGRGDHARGLLERNPVAAVVLESMAAAHPRSSEEIKAAGSLFLDLIGANELGTTRLTLPIAVQVLNRDEAVPVPRVRVYLAEVAERDLLLGLCIHALFGSAGISKRWRQYREREAVMRTIYLLMRMFEAQEEADQLDRAVGVDERSERRDVWFFGGS